MVEERARTGGGRGSSPGVDCRRDGHPASILERAVLVGTLLAFQPAADPPDVPERGCVEGSADLAGPGVFRIQCEYLPGERFRVRALRRPRSV